MSGTSTTGSGFHGAAGGPVASTKLTSSEGLVTGGVTIPAGDRGIPAFVARPARPGAFPVVLVIHEIFGVHEHIKDVARRLAHAGYVAVAPELFIRQGNVAELTDLAEIRAVVARVPDAQVMSDLEAALAWARSQPFADAAPAGVIGFCWGGRIAWLFADHHPSLGAAVAFYGRLQGEHTALQPKHPLDVAAALRVPGLGLYGEADAGIPVAQVEALRTKLRDAPAGTVSEVVLYPEAPHAFFADNRPSYRAEAAADAWQRVLLWLGRHLAR